MSDKRDGTRAGWLAVACAASSLIVVAAIAHCQTPIEIAASRLRVGMTQKEVEKVLSPEVVYRRRFVSWDPFKVVFDNGFQMTFADDKLTGWEIGHRPEFLGITNTTRRKRQGMTRPLGR
jgi:hypothetical protein